MFVCMYVVHMYVYLSQWQVYMCAYTVSTLNKRHSALISPPTISKIKCSPVKMPHTRVFMTVVRILSFLHISSDIVQLGFQIC